MQSRNYATKKKGKTEVYPFWNLEDVYKMINYFKERGDWDNYLIFMLGLLLGRRIGDTVMVKWSDFYYENGVQKSEINTIEEQKTGKFTNLPVSNYVFACIKLYCEKKSIDPMDFYDCFIFNFSAKTDWIKRKNNPIYKENDLNKWCNYLRKDFSDARKKTIMTNFNKQSDYDMLGDYLYYVVEYNDVVKWQTDNFRKAFKKAAEFCDIKYNVSCHSLRKTFGYWSKMIHPDDPNALEILQSIFNHTDTETTLKYIGLSEIRKKEYFNDFGDMISNVENGNTEVMINNSPIISLKHEDLRKIISYIIENKNIDSDINIFNKAMDMVDKLKIKNL